MKKPGFLKRIFSFGRKKQEDVSDTIVETESAADTQEEAVTEVPVDHGIEPTEPTRGLLDVDEITTAAADILPSEPTQIDGVEGKAEAVEEASETKVFSEHEVEDATDTGPEEQDVDDQSATVDMDSAGHEPESRLPVQTAIEAVHEKPDLPPEKDDAALAPDGKSDGTPEKPDLNIIAKPAVAQAEDTPIEPEEGNSWFNRLSQGLARTSSQLSQNIASVFTKKKLDDDALEELEDILLQADLGMDTALNIVDSLAKQRMGKDVSDEEVRSIMAEEIEKVLAPVAKPLELDLDHKPHVILVVGVNGSGKTTTIGKLSQKLRDGGYSSVLVAGDTFRAAAIEQLEIWGERTGAKVVSRPLGSDSSGLAYDAWQSARDEGCDVMMMDTAGRLQNKTELMAELEKIIRVLKKQDPTAPHTVLLTLDATTGQNALNQVEIFGKVAGVNGLIMTKLDGSARGGILVAISAKYQLPVYFVGVGERVEDLEPFEARDFARSIAGLNN